MTHDLRGEVALVTGASRGLGAAIARKLAACGARVAVNYFGSPEKARQVIDQIHRDGGTAEGFQADVREESAVDGLVEQVKKKLGPIGVLVINATGPQPFIRIEDLTWRHCLDQLEFFVKSPLLLVKAVLPAMKERRCGRIINIGSEVFERGVPEFSNYVSAKGAQLGLTRSWAMELAAWQITVNLVAPGWIPRNDTSTIRKRRRTLMRRRCRCGAWARRTTSPRPSRSWPPPAVASSPDRNCRSTAATPSPDGGASGEPRRLSSCRKTGRAPMLKTDEKVKSKAGPSAGEGVTTWMRDERPEPGPPRFRRMLIPP